MKKNSLFWFRRDLRLYDNHSLFQALKNSDSVACIFIFDKNILENLPSSDKRVNFIWETIQDLKQELLDIGSDLIVSYGDPVEVITSLANKYKVSSVYCNEDYEPYARKRDDLIKESLQKNNISFHSFKDHVVFSKDEILSSQNQIFTVFTHYANAWKKNFKIDFIQTFNTVEFFSKFSKFKTREYISLEDMGFINLNLRNTKLSFSYDGAKKLLDNFSTKKILSYKENRDIPSISGTSFLSLHNRFGTISVRELLRKAFEVRKLNSENVDSWINEIIWRDFYFQIMYNFPHVAYTPFLSKYENFPWENDMELFQKWCDGKTGYPIVDAAMIQLNTTGFMHNRLRMIVASFLTKNLLIDYKLGESYFAQKLMDFDLSANNGGWQWSASTGCDSQPYFRIFNPILQSEKFDPDCKFIKKFLPIFKDIDPKFIHEPFSYQKELLALGIELGKDYPNKIVDYKTSRQNTINTFNNFLK